MTESVPEPAATGEGAQPSYPTAADALPPLQEA